MTHRLPSARRAVCALALSGALALPSLPVIAQTDPGLTSRGVQTRVEKDSAVGRVVAMVYEGRHSYVRIEVREPGAALNQHPAQVDPAALRALLERVQLPGSRTEPLFNKAELDELVPPLAQALARATPEQDVAFAISGQHGFMGPLAARLVTTARVFFNEGRLNLVFGLVRRDFESQFKATGYLIAFEPGKRAEPVDRAVRVAAGFGGAPRRADWLVLDPSATPAPVAAPPAPPPPAVVVPAPSAAPAPATAAAPAATPAPRPAAPAPAAAPEADALYRQVAERLRALQKLRDGGLITEQEFQEKRREILKAL